MIALFSFRLGFTLTKNSKFFKNIWILFFPEFIDQNYYIYGKLLLSYCSSFETVQLWHSLICIVKLRISDKIISIFSDTRKAIEDDVFDIFIGCHFDWCGNGLRWNWSEIFFSFLSIPIFYWKLKEFALKFNFENCTCVLLHLLFMN